MQLAELLPEGLASTDHDLLTLWEGDEQVGMLWLNTRHAADGDHVVALELNVFGDNLGARALYEEMGFEPTAIQMRKRL